ncbi:MAG TPA: FKBP-type peptidyl-prolyl cis-trans isomerase [Myxococcales bacterium]|nr:FKBP-type peptidyl-prolyl cis-trans isomerase [Myxococcales bacterium]
MVRIILAVLVLAPFAASAQKTEEEKTLYAIGYVLGERLHSLQLTKAQMKLVDQGFSDAKVGTKAKVDPRERQQQISEFAQHRSQEVAAKTAGPNKEKGKAFADKLAKEPGAEKFPSGLVKKTVKPGNGPMPKETDKVKVNYEGKLVDGTVFDSSYKRGQPAEFPLNGVIKCWTEGVSKMKVGEEAQLVCPSDIAYGDMGRPSIPPGSTLVFKVELLEIEGGTSAQQSTPKAPPK